MRFLVGIFLAAAHLKSKGDILDRARGLDDSNRRASIAVRWCGTRVDLALDISRHRAGRATLVVADDDGSIGDFREKKRPLRDIMPKYGRITA